MHDPMTVLFSSVDAWLDFDAPIEVVNFFDWLQIVLGI